MGGTGAGGRNNVTLMGRADGPVVMLANGFGCDQNMWRLVTPGLARDFRVVLFDHVGSGRPDLSAWRSERYSSLDGYADDVLRICRELELRDVIFVGLGWSTAMAPVIMGVPGRPELGEEATLAAIRLLRRQPPVVSGSVPGPASGGPDDDHRGQQTAVPSLLEDSAEDLYEHAPCGYLSTLPDGQIAKINTTLLSWLGYTRDQLVGRRYFSDLLTVGGRLYHETHFAPLLSMQGEIGGVALELLAADGTRLPVLVTSVIKTGAAGEPRLIRTTIFDARDRRAYERELLRARQEAELERERLQRLVTTLQRSLLPPALPAVPGLDAAAHYHIASLDQVGGDFYDLFPLSQDRWGLFLGDVCGKGARAAALTSLIRYTLRAAAVYDSDPGTVLSTLNTALHEEFLRDHRNFCTAIFGLLTPDGDGFSVTLASGGHPAPLLIRGNGTADFLPMPVGQLIGAWDDGAFTAARIRLDRGDTLLLYTDGLIEARTITSTGRYGDEALRAFAASLAPTTAAAAIAAITALLDGLGNGVDDDTAILALSVPGPAR